MTIYMFNIHILCLYNISYIRPSKKETSFSSGLFFKLEGGTYYLLLIAFFLLF